MKVTLSQYRNSVWSPAPPHLPDDMQSLVIVFGAAHFTNDSPAIVELRKLSASGMLIGCSTSGEILGTELFDDTLSVAVVSFERSTLRSIAVPINAIEDSKAVGRDLALSLTAPGIKGVYVLSDGLCVNGTELVRGMTEVLPDNVPITGGLAGDGDRFKSTWVLTNEGLAKKQVAAIGFYGESIKMGSGSKGGWDTFGAARRITKSKSNVLFELDEKPALELYKRYLGERAKGLPATALLFPLSLKEKQSDQHEIVRTILAVNEEEQSLTFAGDMPEGSYATFMRANFDRLVDGAGSAALKAAQETKEALLCLAVSCVGRRLVLGERAEEEIEALREALPSQTSIVGFYSYGEISPSGSRACDLHNQTMTVTTISEDCE